MEGLKGQQGSMASAIGSQNNARPDIQTSFYGINTSNIPYLLTQHSPYLLNFKFHDSGQSLHRRDGHKVYKAYIDQKIIGSCQAFNGDLFYITYNATTSASTLHSFVKKKEGHDEYSATITSLVQIGAGDYIDNFDPITGFSNKVFLHFNVVKPNGSKVIHVLETDKTLSSVKTNSSITVSGVTATPLPLVCHAVYDDTLFVVVEKNPDAYILAWGDKNSTALNKTLIIPNDDEVYAMRTFQESIFIFCEDRVYRVVYDEKAGTAKIEINSESYGLTSNKLLRTVGTVIYYYGASSGLASMMGSTADSILDSAGKQRPSDYYISNFHKIFKARKMCYKKDDKSLYIIGSVNCKYISEAIFWQTKYCKELVNQENYQTELDKFHDEIKGKDRFILEYNISMQRFNLHYYNKDVIGHYNFRMKIAGLREDQSSEIIITEDYVATTSSDFQTDNGEEFPVQLNSIPRASGLFQGFITSNYVANVKYSNNPIPRADGLEGSVFHAPCDLPLSIVSGGVRLYKDDTGRNDVGRRISNTLQIRRSFSGINPSVLVGFSSKDIYVFEGFQINSEMSAMKTQ